MSIKLKMWSVDRIGRRPESIKMLEQNDLHNLSQVLTMDKQSDEQTDKQKKSLHKWQTLNYRVFAAKPLEQQQKISTFCLSSS